MTFSPAVQLICVMSVSALALLYVCGTLRHGDVDALHAMLRGLNDPGPFMIWHVTLSVPLNTTTAA